MDHFNKTVKSGHVNFAHIRDLAHVVDREKAAIGVYLTLESATKPMIEEAVGAGFYHSDGWNKDYPKIQILTVEDLLAGKSVQLRQICKLSNKQKGLTKGQTTNVIFFLRGNQ